MQASIDQAAQATDKKYDSLYKLITNTATSVTAPVKSPESQNTFEPSKGKQDLRWRAKEIGFFDPSYLLKHREGDVISNGKSLYIHSVLLFIERIQDVAAIKGNELVKTQLDICLRGSVLAWYTTELMKQDKIVLRYNPDGVTA